MAVAASARAADADADDAAADGGADAAAPDADGARAHSLPPPPPPPAAAAPAANKGDDEEERAAFSLDDDEEEGEGEATNLRWRLPPTAELIKWHGLLVCGRQVQQVGQLARASLPTGIPGDDRDVPGLGVGAGSGPLSGPVVYEGGSWNSQHNRNEAGYESIGKLATVVPTSTDNLVGGRPAVRPND
ncbi:hypothetical protein T492DRAFT_1145336 [Pavlovales sp. CCMP2436]|nr:hypothetical protein T492DRAFT_1145336 [Pavlovales sp. CCMP2436]